MSKPTPAANTGAKAETSAAKSLPMDAAPPAPTLKNDTAPAAKDAQAHHDSLSKPDASPTPTIKPAEDKVAGEAKGKPAEGNDVEAANTGPAVNEGTGPDVHVIIGSGDPEKQTALKAHGVPNDNAGDDSTLSAEDKALRDATPVSGQNADKPTAAAVKAVKDIAEGKEVSEVPAEVKDAMEKGADATKSTVTPRPVAAAPKVVTPSPVPSKVTTAAANLSTDGAKLTVPAGEMDAPEKYLEKLPESKRGFYAALQSYAIAMAPNKPMTMEEGSGHQRGLYKILQNLVNNESEYFHYSWLTVLAFAYRERNGVFSPKNIMRFMDNVNLSLEERKSFQRILDLVMMTADPKSRKDRLTQVDMEDVLRYELNNAGRERMREFYDKFK